MERQEPTDASYKLSLDLRPGFIASTRPKCDKDRSREMRKCKKASSDLSIELIVSNLHLQDERRNRTGRGSHFPCFELKYLTPFSLETLAYLVTKALTFSFGVVSFSM